MSRDEDREYEIGQKHRHDPRLDPIEDESVCADCGDFECSCEELEIDDSDEDEGFEDDETGDDSDLDEDDDGGYFERTRRYL